MSRPAEIAIIAAMEREIRPLVCSWKSETVSNAGRSFTLYRNGNAVATCGGPTAPNAAASATFLIENCAPRVMLSVGFAGSLVPHLQVADIVVPERVIDAATGRAFNTDCGSGTLVTGDKVAGIKEKAENASRYSAIAVDMEAAAVAQVAQARGLQFAAVKAISDDASTEMDFVGRFVEPSGFRTGAFLAYVAPRPRLWPVVRQLRINSERASSNLSSTLAAILSSPEGVIGALATFAREHAASIA